MDAAAKYPAMKDSHFRILRTHITAAGSYHGKAWKAFKPNRDVELATGNDLWMNRAQT
jgi:hypothetical protein